MVTFIVPAYALSMTPAIKAAAIESVGSILKDADSAKYSSLRVLKGTNEKTIIVCGLVNAKNSYGGYGGKVPFRTEMVALTDKDGRPAYFGPAPMVSSNSESDVRIFYNVTTDCQW